MNYTKTANQNLGRKTIQEFKESSKTPIVLVLDNIRSMANVGSIFRTADAFLIEKIFLCGITPTPPHREINKTALGATETVTWFFETNILKVCQTLKKENFQIVAIEQTNHSQLLHTFDFSFDKKYAFVLGNEIDGISDECLSAVDLCIEIMQLGSKHSFNVSVCAGIVLWESYRKMFLQ